MKFSWNNKEDKFNKFAYIEIVRYRLKKKKRRKRYNNQYIKLITRIPRNNKVSKIGSKLVINRPYEVFWLNV